VTGGKQNKFTRANEGARFVSPNDLILEK